MLLRSRPWCPCRHCSSLFTLPRVASVPPVTLALTPIVPRVPPSLPCSLCLLSSFSCAYVPPVPVSLPGLSCLFPIVAMPTMWFRWHCRVYSVCARVACINPGPGQAWVCVVECCQGKTYPYDSVSCSSSGLLRLSSCWWHSQFPLWIRVGLCKWVHDHAHDHKSS